MEEEEEADAVVVARPSSSDVGAPSPDRGSTIRSEQAAAIGSRNMTTAMAGRREPARPGVTRCNPTPSTIQPNALEPIEPPPRILLFSLMSRKHNPDVKHISTLIFNRPRTILS